MSTVLPASSQCWQLRAAQPVCLDLQSFICSSARQWRNDLAERQDPEETRHEVLASPQALVFARGPQGRHRQEALLGRLLRELEDEDSAAIADAVGGAEIGRGSPAGIADPAAERLALSWRDGLVAGASLLWCQRHACASPAFDDRA